MCDYMSFETVLFQGSPQIEHNGELDIPSIPPGLYCKHRLHSLHCHVDYGLFPYLSFTHWGRYCVKFVWIRFLSAGLENTIEGRFDCTFYKIVTLVSWHSYSSTTRLIVQQLVLANNKDNLQILAYQAISEWNTPTDFLHHWPAICLSAWSKFTRMCIFVNYLN